MNRKQVLKLFRSPEGLEVELLAGYDQLEQLAREQIQSGAAVVSVTDDQAATLPGVRPVVPREKYPMTGEQKRQTIADAVREIERRRGLVRQHYKGLHASFLNAFPVTECWRE